MGKSSADIQEFLISRDRGLLESGLEPFHSASFRAEYGFPKRRSHVFTLDSKDVSFRHHSAGSGGQRIGGCSS
jgi:hypothetical protein